MTRHAARRSEPSVTPRGRVGRVAVDALADRPERTFSYLLPAGARHPTRGRSSSSRTAGGSRSATCSPVRREPGGADLRPIEAVVSAPMLTPDLLALAEEIAAYFRAPIGTTLAAMLPPGLESRLDRRWELAASRRSAERASPPRPTATARSPTPRSCGRAPKARPRGVARAAASRRARSAPTGRCGRRTSTARRVRRPPPAAGDAEPPRRAPVQRALLEALGGEERTMAELAEALDAEPAALLAPARRLVALGRAELGLAHRRARPARAPADRGRPAARRSRDEQVAALDAIARPATGRGAPARGRGRLGQDRRLPRRRRRRRSPPAGTRSSSCPEMSLVPQLADRFAPLVGDELAVLHSGLSAGERHDEWWRILRGEARVVVGTRTAAFAPVGALGLIVVDEEHDGGYKSDRTPRYDARWVARRRAALAGARVVLGSATPDLVSLARVRGGHAERARLVERRVGGGPAIEVADLRAELAGGQPVDLLRGAGRRHRRAASAAASRPCCSSTGAEPPRSSCAATAARACAALTASCRSSTTSTAARCAAITAAARPRRPTLPGVRQQRGSATSAPARSASRPSCARAFPDLRIGRLDSDALAARRGFETIYDDFREGRTDVLVGTQLAAKGLDLPSVTLAAVVAADVTLNLPDYRAAERTFQLARAGRRPRRARTAARAG